MKVAELLRLLHGDGWYLVTARGSHPQLELAARRPVSPSQGNRATISGSVLWPASSNRQDSGGEAAIETQIREAIEFHLEGLRDDGLPIPLPSSQVEYIEIAA